MGRESAHEPTPVGSCRGVRAGRGVRKRTRQGAVAHRGGVGETAPQHGIARGPEADAALGGQGILRGDGRAIVRLVDRQLA